MFFTRTILVYTLYIQEHTEVNAIIGVTVKIRKSGNSNILTLPTEIKPIAKEFTVFQGRDGEIVYTPKKANPFKGEKWVQAHEHSTQKEAFDGSDFGTEFSD